MTGLPCDDGLWCTVDDICLAGICFSGDERSCPGTMICNEEAETCQWGENEEEPGPQTDKGCQMSGSSGRSHASGLLAFLLSALIA
jgi:hypothetical protein